MNSYELRERINKLSIWKKGDQRAPHKPLLILYALGRFQDSSTQKISYEEVKNNLTILLKDFGPIRKSYHPEEPFVRLFKDVIWNFNIDRDIIQISNKWLINHEIAGGFSDEVFSLLSKDITLVKEIAEIILNKHFPDTLHEDILTAVGLNIEYGNNRVRDPKFRNRILKAYEYSCAICGFNVRLGHNLVGVEAAHIKWHQAGGPDNEQNGVALCSMHHKLFDRGIFSISNDREIIISEEAHGTNGFDEWLMRFHGKQLRPPVHPEYYPNNSFINWHVREVFRGPGRYTVV